MASMPVLTAAGTKKGSIDLADSLFGAKVSPPLIHQAAMAQLEARRVGTADTLTRGQVRGGGRKPWRQKGTGRARQGSIRSPQWRGGGVVFGPHPREFGVKVNDKVRRAALRGALSAKAADGAVKVVEGFGMDKIQTKALVERLAGWEVEGRALLVLAERDEIVERSAANLREVRIILAHSLNVVDLLEADTIVFTKDAVARAEAVFA